MWAFRKILNGHNEIKTDYKYSIKITLGMIAISCVLIALSATVALGYGKNNPLIDNTASQQSSTQSQDDKILSAEESLTQLERDERVAEETYGPAEKSINNFNATNDGNGGYNVHWISTAAAATDYTTPVNYTNIADDTAIPGFQTTDEYRNWSSSSEITYNTQWGHGPNMQSHWDVRYFEDVYTASGKTWAYAGSAITYTATGGTTATVQMTKLAYAGADASSADWYYRNDLSSENTSGNGWVHITDCQDEKSVQIFIYFKDVTGQTGSSKDFTISWTGSNNFGKGYVQYLYSTAERGATVTEDSCHKMQAPFAADMEMPANTTQQNIAGMTMKNYCGRYVKQPDGSGGYIPCVYRESWIAFVPKGTTPETVTWENTYGVTIARQDQQGTYYFYTRDSGGNWTRTTYAAESYDVWINMIYGASISTDLTNKGYTWSTVDNVSKGVNINVFDYDAWRTLANNFQDLGINSYGNFKFSNGNLVPQGTNNMNRFTDGATRRTGIFKNTLGENGFPVLSSDNQELRYLFDPNYNGVTYRKDYIGMNHFFNAPYYNKTGYYFYDSDENSEGEYSTPGNFAQVRKNPSNTSDNDFIVYSDPSLITGEEDPPKFMPFDDKDNNNSDNRDYLFGMTVDTKFIQPTDGILVPAAESEYGIDEEMVFNFKGDDDVLVYFDGVLVLDIGGIHRAVEGTVNFHTGQVKYSDTQTVTSLKSLYDAAGVTVEWEDAGDGYYRYADYSVHTMNFFYLERGMGASNCRLAFNMPTMPAGSILLGKDVLGDGVAHVDGDFSYKVQVSEYDENTEQYGEWHDYVSPQDEQGAYIPLNVYEGSTTSWDPEKLVKQVVVTPNDHGQIGIKDGNVAVLNGFNAKDRFKIVEFDPRETAESEESKALDLLWTVYCNGTQVTSADVFDIVYYDPETGESKTIKGYGTDTLYVGSNDAIQFSNEVNEDSLFDLHIKKTGKDSSNSVISLSFDEREDPSGGDPVRVPYSGPYFYVSYDETEQEYVVISEHQTTTGLITLNETGDNAEIVVPDVQMDARANLMVQDLTTHKTVSYWVTEFVEPGSGEPYPSGSMSNPQPSNPCNTNKFYAQIPFYLDITPETRAEHSVRQVNYGTINLEVSNLQNSLKISKVCEGSYASRSKEFELSVIIQDDSNPPNFMPSREGTVESPYYNASIYKIESDPQDVLANFNSQGELIISYDNGTTWGYPKLRDTEYLIVDSVIVPTYGYISGFEERVASYTIMFNEITMDDLDIPVTTEYISGQGEAASYLKNQTPVMMRVGTDDDTNVVSIENTMDAPESGFDLIKNPELIAFLAAILLILLIVGPLKLLLIRRRRKLETLKLNSFDDALFKDDFSW